MKNRQTGFSQELSALKAGISIRSGRRIEKGDGDIDAGVLCYTLFLNATNC